MWSANGYGEVENADKPDSLARASVFSTKISCRNTSRLARKGFLRMNFSKMCQIIYINFGPKNRFSICWCFPALPKILFLLKYYMNVLLFVWSLATACRTKDEAPPCFFILVALRFGWAQCACSGKVYRGCKYNFIIVGIFSGFLTTLKVSKPVSCCSVVIYTKLFASVKS